MIILRINCEDIVEASDSDDANTHRRSFVNLHSDSTYFCLPSSCPDF